MQRTIAAALCLLLAACYDFEGEAGVLGFSTNLIAGPATWTPDRAVARGTTLVAQPTEWLETGADVTETDGLEQKSRRSAGTLWWEGHDGFHARFARAQSGHLVDPSRAVLGLPALEPKFAVVAGTEVIVSAGLVDRRGQPLGYDPADLTVDASGALSAWVEPDGGLHISADGAPGEPGFLTVALNDRELINAEVVLVATKDLLLETHWAPDVEEPLLLATLADGTPTILGQPKPTAPATSTR